MTVKRHDNPYNLCHFEFSDGRQCCMPATNGNFCRSHHQLHQFRRRAPAEADLSSELTAYFSGPDSSLDVHRALERVFKALSDNRISTRRAATFGYLGQLILLSKPGEESQSLSKSELHKMCDVTCRLLQTAFGPDGKRPQPSEQPQSPTEQSAAGTPHPPSNAAPPRAK
jgi:hypothetical protein